MTARLYRLIHQLADGRFHSGEALGKAMGVSRAAVWKMLPKLEALGLEVYAVSGKGYRLARSFEPLEREHILGRLDSESRALVAELITLYQTDSTNQQLLEAARTGLPSGSVCVAEFQTGGRGRRGRQWLSPYGSNVYLSLLWRFQQGTAHLGGLSLAVAVALMRMLLELGVEGAGIKWPNDILLEGRKLAGVLIDVVGENSGPCYAVIGVGLNYRMPDEAGEQIDQPWTDLWQQGVRTGRNQLVGRLLHHLVKVVKEYQAGGLEAFRGEWSHYDITRDHEVTIHHGHGLIHGIARGVDQQGLLLLEQPEGVHRYAAGEVSLEKGMK
ncbi:MAG: bifunctional biotin--[acetyl-CoA-carboxylase] ligase/biotin operon repressor BirA [Gammaproteobacteria bacterium]|nr:bifunctional biotin--[acetyl-CoA-carboxylase] ligase/biotin operon repressor BirA [Gammaproteobacteria bacterium]MCW8839381.1 bifunctional biotin--[acetyl-CoA-carboxylase] ligase/biotin operon repressor BirA [Gammaproteobacteria bacterium]MCW8928034.1 bifunctional biotin--[acetyl-CoA-carboxylase] ligase/biotin operon repressor BirA [Gammaproteobacteria bacterium]MCW8958005.1 bifunctional biotin--[acetyl-CoA-carboxylase] ligase/biotin operon repressor BirA [Gammaproteobacteria bacterium]MCW89